MVVGGTVVVVVLDPPFSVVVVVPPPPWVDDEPPVAVVVVLLLPLAGAVVVVGGAAGATKGTDSARMVATLVEGVAARLVQVRAAFQLCRAVCAGAPVSGWGRPLRMVAGRKAAAVT